MKDEHCACAHTKITEITWYVPGGYGKRSGKFMCLDCNSDFVLLTPEIRAYLRDKAAQEMWDKDEQNEHL